MDRIGAFELRGNLGEGGMGQVFRAYDGRPHWGKAHARTGAELAEIHPGYRRWWELRDRYDPSGMFVTPDLAALRP